MLDVCICLFQCFSRIKEAVRSWLVGILACALAQRSVYLCTGDVMTLSLCVTVPKPTASILLGPGLLVPAFPAPASLQRPVYVTECMGLFLLSGGGGCGG